MQWNLMDIGITDVHSVILMIENHYRLWERHCNNNTEKCSKKEITTKIRINSSRNVVLRLQIIPYIKQFKSSRRTT